MNPNNPHTIGLRGLDIIRLYESLRLTPYLCPSNKLTIGYGHVLLPKRDASLFGITPDNLKRIIVECRQLRRVTAEAKQLRISPIKADDLLEFDAGETALYLRSVTPVLLNQNQFDALCSFIFNVGQGAYGESTLRRKLRDGDYAGAAAEFDRWIYGTTADGEKVVLPGLIDRRRIERALFMTQE